MRRVLEAWRRLPVLVRRGGVAVVGGLLLAGGAALLVLPGPGLVVIGLGLLVLATEFTWPRRLLRQVAARLPERWRHRATGPGRPL
ncbi:MAG TPA: PGPGW domain-containing protein [Candidatus Dormibacteraeota bacterium]|nr:PGPGW domain-containing protein [Candidatus Dormibacteraeota bacterium]